MWSEAVASGEYNPPNDHSGGPPPPSEGQHHETPSQQSSEQPLKDEAPMPAGKFLEAAALLSHVQMLESKLPPDETEFGHAPPPELHLCRIPDPERPGKELPVTVLMAVTKRCVSAQLLRESKTYASLGPPVEVLVMSGNDKISCAAIFALERLELTAPDTAIIPDRGQQQQQQHKQTEGSVSLMSGGLIPVKPSPRIAMVVGTVHNRLISIEFSLRLKNVMLIRRNFVSGTETRTFFEPLPRNVLTPSQERRRGKKAPKRKGDEPLHPLDRSYSAVAPFEPKGGVVSLAPYSIWNDEEQRPVTHVWVSFGDGTGVRLHHAGFFASVVQKYHEDTIDPKGRAQPSLEYILNEQTVRWQARLPPLPDSSVTLVPVPKYHPSPLAPFPMWKKPDLEETSYDSTDFDSTELHQCVFEAVAFASGPMPDSFPTLVFYTSEDQFGGRAHDDLEEDSLEGNGAGLVSTVIGGIFGLITRSAPSEKSKDDEKELPVIAGKDQFDPAVPFPVINYEPLSLYAGCEIHDPPRHITHCSVDPEGDLVAMSDSLGRVSLVDLSTKQVVRMWKGFRDTSCYWMQVPKKTRDTPWQKPKTLYLVIHSRQRKVIEIWRTRQGPRVKSMQVGREAQVICSRELSPVGYVATCYLAHSNVPFSKMNQVERILVQEDEKEGTSQATRNRLARPDLSKLSQDAAARLNRLQQLLGETNVECESIDVFKSLERINSVEDLSTALDLLAKAPTLEQKMSVDGSTFQRLAISHCTEKLNESIREAGEDAVKNEHIQKLAFKLAYYTQVCSAYDVLRKHESQEQETSSNVKIVAPSAWGLEAAQWTATYEKITKALIDIDVPNQPDSPMTFCEFASALEEPKHWMEEEADFESGRQGYSIHFSDSTKTRKEILMRIFKPLLGDLFSFNIVNQVFEALGMEDSEYMLKCFGEWFTLLSVKDATKKAIFAEDSSTTRWLQAIVRTQLKELVESGKQPMESLFEFCRTSEELVRAFWLATLCRESIVKLAAEEEEQSYGEVSSEEVVGRWEHLLRQLRMCLLVSLRLYGIQLGACPISIAAVDKGDNFSVFEWLAHDELQLSHNHEEIVSLENACRMSSHAFDPSSAEGDDPAKIKILQKACLTSALSEEERAEYLIDFDDEDGLGSLLLFVKHHNKSEYLVAQRALLLAAKWGREPHDLSLLDDALVALQAIDPEESKRIASSVRLEIWQSRIRPVYRALLMGFDDVQEISPEVVGPLLRNPDWVKHFSDVAGTAFNMLNDFQWHEDERLDLYDDEIEEDPETWPPLSDCFLLRRHVEKNQHVMISAFEAHKTLMIALRVSQDVTTLSKCIPSFYDLFTPGALFEKVVELPDAEEKQHGFMQEAIVDYAYNYNGPMMDTLDLGDIETLCDLWEFEMENVRTLFLLAMYEYGKDKTVDELISKSPSSISGHHFCEDGVEIVCRRLDKLLHHDPSDQTRQIMGSLDAEMCEWIRTKAEKSEALVDNGVLDVPAGNTHLFALRLLSLATSADISRDDRIKIHALIVLSGSVVKALEETIDDNGSLGEPTLDVGDSVELLDTMENEEASQNSSDVSDTPE